MNVTMLLDMVIQAAGDRGALTCGQQSWSYSDLDRRARRYAAAVRRHEVAAVAYLGENSPEAVALFLGCQRAGVSYVPVNYRWTDAQLAEALQRLAPVGVVADERSRARVAGLDGVRLLDPPEQDPEPVASKGPDPDTAGIRADEDDAFTDDAFTDGEFAAVLLFTSGTSGTPKAAVLRNRHLVPYVVTTVEFLNAAEGEAILVAVPPYHIAAVSSMLTSLYAGRRMVLMPTFEPASWVDAARREGVTQAMVVPTMLSRILDVVEADGLGLPGLRHLSYGGGRMPVQVIERVMRLLPDVDLVNAYGLTETSSTITLLGPQDHREAAASTDPDVRARLGSVGRALPGVEIEIRDDAGAVVGAGEPGEIWVRGDQVSGEYLSHSAVGADGWYPTRDHGHLDSDGFLFLHGRADDVIVRGGENIAPAEIEDRLAAHADVAEVAVVGIPDPEWGERVEAFVVPAPGADLDHDALREWVRDGLRSTRVPAVLHACAELPYNETGKLLRRELKARRVAELAANA